MTDFSPGTAADASSHAVPARETGRTAIRAATLECLQRADEPQGLVEVAECVADAVDGLPGGSRRERVQRVYLQLVRGHVPALEDRGAVEYDPENGTLGLADSDAL